MMTIPTPFRTAALAAAVLAVGLSAGACKPTEGAFAGQRQAGYEVPMNNVGILSEHLSKTLAVEAVNSTRNNTNMLEVWVQLRNRLGERRPVSVRTNFYDANKRPLETTPWQLVYIEPRGVASYSVATIKPDAAQYYVEVKEANQ